MYVVPSRNSLRKLEMHAKKTLRRTSRRPTIALPKGSSLLKSIHTHGNGDVCIHPGSPQWWLEAPSNCTGVVHKVLLCARQDLLSEDDPPLPSWNGIPRIIRPEIYREFITGNWVVNKNKEVPFCAVGGDTALEHLNWSMKVSGGLVGIILNESARTNFFLIAPELALLTAEAKAMVGLVPERAHHQELNSAVLTQ